MKTDLQLFMDGLVCRKHQKMLEQYNLKSKFKRMRKNSMTIYKQNNNSDKVVVFLTGGAVLKLSHYIQKMIDDLRIRNRDVLVFEDLRKFNLTCIPTIASILQTMSYSEITIVGCSMGGVIGSHILSQLNDTYIKKRLICIETPFRISLTIIQAFEQKFCFWRPDIFALYNFTIELVQGKSNYSDLFQITRLEQYKEYVWQHFGIDNYDFLSSMNPDLKNVEIISLYNEQDPVVIRHYSIPTVENYKQLLDNSSSFKEVRIKYDGPGHCTEWSSEAKSEAKSGAKSETKSGAKSETKSDSINFIRQLRKLI